MAVGHHVWECYGATNPFQTYLIRLDPCGEGSESAVLTSIAQTPWIHPPHQRSDGGMRTPHLDPAGTQATLSAAVLIALAVNQTAPSPGHVHTANSYARDRILIGESADGRILPRTNSALTAPLLDTETGAYTFAIEAHNASAYAVDWILGIELLRTAFEVGQVKLAVRTGENAAWSSSLAIDTSGNPAFCAVPNLMPSATQDVHFRIWVPHPTGTTSLSASVTTIQSDSRPGRRRLPTNWLSRS